MSVHLILVCQARYVFTWCVPVFILIINFSPVIVLHSYNPPHHAYHRRYRVCIFSGLCTKIVTSNVNMFTELAVHHDRASFPYYVLHTLGTLGKRIQYTCSFYVDIYLMTNSLNLNSCSISYQIFTVFPTICVLATINVHTMEFQIWKIHISNLVKLNITN